MPLCASRSTTMVAAMRRRLPSSSNLSIMHGAAVGQLVAGQAEQLLAHDLAGQEAVAAVGERVFLVQPLAFGQVRREDLEQALHVGVLLRRHRHELGEGMALLHALQPGQHVVAALDGVELVGDQQHRLVRRQQRQHLGIVQPEAAGLDHEQHHVDVGQRGQHGAVERAVQRGAVLHLEAGRVDEDELRRPDRADAGDAVARGLRLARGDADLLPDQRVQQRATCRRSAGRRWPPGRSAARIGSASDRRLSGADARSSRSQRAAGPVAGLQALRACGARPPARRRGASGLRRARPGRARRPAHSTSKVCACAWPRVATMR